MTKFILVLILVIVFNILCRQNVLAGRINMTEYFQMPPMYLLEDYDRCFQEFPDTKATYCYVRALIKPNSSSEIWNITNKFSSDRKRFYRHDRLVRGICMNQCKDKMKNFDYDTRMQYYVHKFTEDTEIEYDRDLFRNALVDRAQYSKYASMCVNYELMHKYDGLKAQTEIEYCLTNQDEIELDSVDVAFVVMMVVLVIVIILSTSYDFHLKRCNLPHLCNKEHYKNPINGDSYASYLVSFSLPRNWYKLTGDTTPASELSRDLRSINAIRVMCMFGVMLGHAALSTSIAPVNNPQFLESKYYSIPSMILINGANVLQAYFAITGYLISVQFMDLKGKHKFKMSFFWKALIYRYLRFLPVYAFFIFFHATWLMKVQHGPIWPHFADTERSVCRKNWWANLLYVNNFFTASEPCVQHAWYLAADFQLIVVGTILQMVMWRYPKLTKPLLWCCLLASFAIPTYVTYVNSFDGIFMATPENQRYAHWYDVMYHKIYIPFYTNFGSFLFGMIGGLLYCKHKQGHIDLTKTKWLGILWYSMIPIAFSALLSGYIFYEYNFEKPALWIGIYSACMKNVWGLFGATVITGVALGTGWIIRDIFRLPIFRTMGKLTFGAYLIHPAVIRIAYGNMRQPGYASDLRILEILVSSYFISYFLSIVLSLTIEIPFSVLQRQLYRRDVHQIQTKTIYETTNEAEVRKLSKTINELELKHKIPC